MSGGIFRKLRGDPKEVTITALIVLAGVVSAAGVIEIAMHL